MQPLADESPSRWRVRRATPADAATVRQVRLEALADAPQEFGATLERERALTIADWEARLGGPGATFVLEHPEGARGLVAGVPYSEEPTGLLLVSMWVDPRLRGRGAADALIQSVLEWAKGAGAGSVWLEVTRANLRARRCYDRNGFRDTGRETVRPRDGTIEVVMRHDLDRGAP